ncbi:tetratricopeptide repeat protein [Vibrio sp. 404]|uniref:Tetratricopeptide repeat protein n=1 Tax=Vibrio marinisediminis TaxID=2758441 RepID=A0A7W2IV42_9VIBR|nr:tetratricopeptide repeat protein [Vibrio marinisediminis]MBA5763687.1 tetratricopeptide repeat protein [Vibrio marinisediminis]
MKKVLITSMLLSIPAFFVLRGSPPTPDVLKQEVFTHQQQMSDIQAALQQDPNQADLWFQLGHGYLNQQEFQSALICFDYAVRLNDEPSASQIAAKATAIYYIEKQRITEEVKGLLEQALELEPDNMTALTLMASDHFISLRYSQAVALWTQLLESQNPDLDRVSIIQALNQAKQMQASQ